MMKHFDYLNQDFLIQQAIIQSTLFHNKDTSSTPSIIIIAYPQFYYKLKDAQRTSHHNDQTILMLPRTSNNASGSNSQAKTN